MVIRGRVKLQRAYKGAIKNEEASGVRGEPQRASYPKFFAMLNHKTQQIENCNPIPEEYGSDPGTELDWSLAKRAGFGNRWAAEQLVRRYQDRAFATAYRMCGGNSEQAQDVTQDAFLKALKNIGRFKGQSSFYTWFYRILVNTFLDARRRKQRWSRIFPFRRRHGAQDFSALPAQEDFQDPDENVNPMEALSSRQLQKDLNGAMENLPDKQRTVFQLKVLEGMKIREIAKIMKLSQGTVKSHLFRATRTVRTAMVHWVEK